MTPLESYRSDERLLLRVRWCHAGGHSPEEDEILERMAAIWWELSDEERAGLNNEEPRSLIRTIAGVGARALHDTDVYARPNDAPRAEVA
ncbi:MAG: hypothetical protein QM767_21700 [Anaeromyxobacter sp.]